MPKKLKADARMGDIKEQFLAHAQELWDKHEPEFAAVLAESDTNKLNLSFTATLDFSESTAKLQTTMRFSQVVSDRKDADFDDPNQKALPLAAPEEAGGDGEDTAGNGGGRKRGGRRRAGDDDAA